MGLRFWNGVVLSALGVLWLASGTQREKPVLGLHGAEVSALETDLAAAPNDPTKIQALGQKYIDAKTPGLAVSLIESQPLVVKTEPSVEHLYARALLEQGRSADALVAEQNVLDRCAAGDSRCSSFLVASATRRADILRELGKLGVEDAQAYPEKSQLAYHNATRQVGLVVSR
jgi:hypothetical protein